MRNAGAHIGAERSANALLLASASLRHAPTSIPLFHPSPSPSPSKLYWPQSGHLYSQYPVRMCCERRPLWITDSITVSCS